MQEELYNQLRIAAASLRGPWWQRLKQAEVRRRLYRRRLEEAGLWTRVAALPWLESFLDGGSRYAPFLDSSTLAWHADQSDDPAWRMEFALRGRASVRLLFMTVHIVAWAIERHISALEDPWKGVE